MALNGLKCYLKRNGDAVKTDSGYDGLVAVELAAVDPALASALNLSASGALLAARR
jgi:hypothetical protein